MTAIIDRPIKFLGATVVSFNCQLGVGSTETSMSIDLVEDCEDSPPDLFLPKEGLIVVGAPVYFTAGAFSFGGILQTWTYTQSGSGRTFNARVTDPRQLLENTAIITDTYLGPPINGINYFNVYSYWEGALLDGNCNVFGNSLGSERGMPYIKVIEALKIMNPILYSPTGYAFSINFNSFPSNVSPHYRVATNGISLLQLLQDVCDVTGHEFYVELLPGNIITIGLINLKIPPPSFSEVVASYNTEAIELSYGQELRNDTTKTVLFGEQQHYLSRVDKFNHFFGEDLIDGKIIPVVPYKYDNCGFWIQKTTASLSVTLNRPLPTNGPYTIHELDIRSAMASQKLWLMRVMTPSIKGTLNKAIRDTWPEGKNDMKAILDAMTRSGQTLNVTIRGRRGNQITDATIQPNRAAAQLARNEIADDLEKVWQFVKNLGDTYYGKQFITPLDQLICCVADPDAAFGDLKVSDTPTNAGGWVDDGVPVLGLIDPELNVFREEDGRIGCFAMFSNDGQAPNEESTTKKTIEDENFKEPELGVPPIVPPIEVPPIEVPPIELPPI